MSKEDFEKWKSENNNLAIYFEYWRENKDSDYQEISLDEFSQKFSQFLANVDGGAVNTRNGIKTINSQVIYNKVIEYFTNKFSV